MPTASDIMTLKRVFLGDIENGNAECIMMQRTTNESFAKLYRHYCAALGRRLPQTKNIRVEAGQATTRKAMIKEAVQPKPGSFATMYRRYAASLGRR